MVKSTSQEILQVFSKPSGRNSMVECQLPKLKVASSSLVARSKFTQQNSRVEFENRWESQFIPQMSHKRIAVSLSGKSQPPEIKLETDFEKRFSGN